MGWRLGVGGWKWVGGWGLGLSSRLGVRGWGFEMGWRLGVGGCFLNVDKDFFAYFLFIIEFINIDL